MSLLYHVTILRALFEMPLHYIKLNKIYLLFPERFFRQLHFNVLIKLILNYDVLKEIVPHWVLDLEDAGFNRDLIRPSTPRWTLKMYSISRFSSLFTFKPCSFISGKLFYCNKFRHPHLSVTSAPCSYSQLVFSISPQVACPERLS